MKYITPSYELEVICTEDIMESAISIEKQETTSGQTKAVGKVNYSDLF